jgi:hypothetical protein
MNINRIFTPTCVLLILFAVCTLSLQFIQTEMAKTQAVWTSANPDSFAKPDAVFYLFSTTHDFFSKHI